MIVPLLGLAALLLTGADPSPGEMKERIRASVRAGSGGPAAAFAACNPDAVIDFYDGHQTPELIPDRLLWWYLLFELRAEAPSGLTKQPAARIAATRAELLQMTERFKAESRRLGWQVVEARSREERTSFQTQSHELSNRLGRESYSVADRSFDALQRELSKSDQTIFAAWLRDHRGSAVVARFDFLKITDWECR